MRADGAKHGAGMDVTNQDGGPIRPEKDRATLTEAAGTRARVAEAFASAGGVGVAARSVPVGGDDDPAVEFSAGQPRHPHPGGSRRRHTARGPAGGLGRPDGGYRFTWEGPRALFDLLRSWARGQLGDDEVRATAAFDDMTDRPPFPEGVLIGVDCVCATAVRPLAELAGVHGWAGSLAALTALLP